MRIRIKTLQGFILLIFLTSVLFINLISIGGYILLSVSAIRHRAEKYLISICKPVAFNLSSLLEIGDHIQIEIVIANLISNRFISDVSLFDKDGFPIYRSTTDLPDYDRIKTLINNQKLIDLEQSGNILELIFPIYGSSYYDSTLRDLSAILIVKGRLDLFLFDAGRMIFSIFLVNIFVTIILSLIFIILSRRYVFGPLVRLKTLAEGITAGRYEEINANGHYEFTEIFKSFNKMSKSLDFYTTRLEIMNRNLAAEVRERTTELEKLKNRFKGIAESFGDILWETDSLMRYVFCSNGIIDTLGYRPEDVIGNSIDFTFENKKGNHNMVTDEKLKALIERKKSFDYQVGNITNEGERVILKISGMPFFDANGSFGGYRGVSKDVTREEELRKNLERIQRIDSLGTLVSSIAHDFNNIINVIQNFASLVLRNFALKGNSREYEFLVEIKKAAERGEALIRKLLVFTRKSSQNKCIILPAEQIRAFKGFMERTIGKSIDVRLILNDCKPGIEMDPMEFDQILMNLAINSRDAMLDGGTITIELQAKTFGPEIENLNIYPGLKKGKYCIIRFSDTGSGMDDKIKERIFEPFYSTKKNGTGLGLSIILAIIRQAGGGIAVESRKGEGTTFTLYFPQCSSVPNMERSKKQISLRLDGKNALIIDDDIQSLNLIEEQLKLLGCETVKAVDCNSLPDNFIKKNKFDLYIVDLEMPGMNGERCIEKILKLHHKANILVVSGYPGDQRIRNAIGMGARSYLEKPFDMESFISRLSQIF